MNKPESVRLELIATTNETTTDVVFVHGLGGDGYETWTADKTDDTKYWPKWLARDFSELCVYSLYYPARLTQWTSKKRGKAKPLETRAENLLGYLSAKRIGKRPCIFIAHSLGGLLVKEILRSSKTGGVPAHAAIADKTQAVVFLATPHQGSTLSNLAEALARVRVLGLSLNWVFRWSPHIKDLRKDSPKLTQLYSWYSNNARSLGFATLALYEQEKVSGSPMLVVDVARANPSVEGAVFMPADADHFGIAKPASDESPIYDVVKSFLERVLQGADAKPGVPDPDTPARPHQVTSGPQTTFKDVSIGSIKTESGGVTAVGGVVTINQRDPATDKAMEAMTAQAEHTRQQLGIKDLQLQRKDEQIDELIAAVNALAQQRGEPDAPLGIEEALAQLGEGNTEAAEAIFQQVADANVATGSEAEATAARANAKAAEAYRHIGALAYLHDTEKALTAYRRATELDPNNPVGWNQRGQLEWRIGNLSEAEESFQTILRLGEPNDNKGWVAAAYGNLGNLYQTRGDLEQAENLYRQSLALVEELGHKEGMANQYGNLGNMYLTRGDLEQAEAMFNSSLALEEELGRKEGMASDYGNLGNVYLTRGDLEQAEAMYNQSLTIEKELGRKGGMASAYGNLGVVYKTRGDLEQAEALYRQSLALHKELGHKEGMANQYGNLGNVYLTRGDLEQAEAMFNSSLALEEELGRKEGMASDYGNLGNVYLTRGDLEQAEAQYRQSLALHKELGRKEGMASNFGNLGNVYLTRGDLEQAEDMYNRALALAEELGHKEGMANQYGNLGIVYKIRGDLEQAEAAWKKSVELYQEVGAAREVELVQSWLDDLQ